MHIVITVATVFVVAQTATLAATFFVCALVSIFNKSPVISKSILLDVLYYWILRPLLYIPLVILLVVFLDFIGWTREGVLTNSPIIVQAISLYLLFEFIGYWIHRLFHWNQQLHRFHTLHHTIDKFQWSNGRKDHFVFELLLLASLVFVGIWLGVAPITFIITIVVWYILLSLSHHNVAFSYGFMDGVLLSARTHGDHHFNISSENTKNFGITLSMYDRIFRTCTTN